MTMHRESLPDPLPAEPMTLTSAWLEEARRRQVQPNPNSMVLATVDANGLPDARVVLCNQIEAQPGCLVFYTNYASAKAQELAAHPVATAVLHWDALRRQVRLRGRITRTSAAQSDAYFAARPWQSRLGAWASQQSEPLASRQALEQAVTAVAQRFGAPSPLTSADDAPDPGVLIARPPHWGGYRLWIESVELWSEGAARLHDRARWTRSLTPTPGGFSAGTWSTTRLQP